MEFKYQRTSKTAKSKIKKTAAYQRNWSMSFLILLMIKKSIFLKTMSI